MLVRGVDEAFESLRAAVHVRSARTGRRRRSPSCGVPGNSAIGSGSMALTPSAFEPRQLLDQAVERALGCGRADVELIDHQALDGGPGQSWSCHSKAFGSTTSDGPCDALGLAARVRVGEETARRGGSDSACQARRRRRAPTRRRRPRGPRRDLRGRRALRRLAWPRRPDAETHTSVASVAPISMVQARLSLTTWGRGARDRSGRGAVGGVFDGHLVAEPAHRDDGRRGDGARLSLTRKRRMCTSIVRPLLASW